MRSNRGSKVNKQACISALIVKSLFFDLISVSAENPNSQNYESGRVILIAFKLIAGYNLLIEIQNSSRLFLTNFD